MDRLSGVCHLDVGGDMGEVGERERDSAKAKAGALNNSAISLASGGSAPACLPASIEL